MGRIENRVAGNKCTVRTDENPIRSFIMIRDWMDELGLESRQMRKETRALNAWLNWRGVWTSKLNVVVPVIKADAVEYSYDKEKNDVSFKFLTE